MEKSPEPTWQTPEQLAREMGRSTRWVADHMLSGDIPSIKIGGQRYFTPECRALLMERQLFEQRAAIAHAVEVADSWDRPVRGRRGVTADEAVEYWGRPPRGRRGA